MLEALRYEKLKDRASERRGLFDKLTRGTGADGVKMETGIPLQAAQFAGPSCLGSINRSCPAQWESTSYCLESSPGIKQS